MDSSRLRALFAAPMAGLFAILIPLVFLAQRPASTGVFIPMMRTRPQPLSNCEFNGFTVYLRTDGRIGGGKRDAVVSLKIMLSRIVEARDNIQDDTIFLIADPDAPYSLVADLTAKIHQIAPADRIALVTRDGLVEGIPTDSGMREQWADRCRFEWPALPGQPKWSAGAPAPLPVEK